MSTKSRAAKNGAPVRPAMSPFDVQLSPAQRAELAKNIEALNVQLELGNRGHFDVPTGHANAIKEAFEGASSLVDDYGDIVPDAEYRRRHGADRRWHVTIVSVNPSFTRITFHADGEPEPLVGEPALALLAQVRAEVAKLLGSIPVPNPQRLPSATLPLNWKTAEYRPESDAPSDEGTDS